MATTVKPMTISETLNLLASDEAPSTRNSAPFMSNANPMTIKIILKNIIMLKPCSLKGLFLCVYFLKLKISINVQKISVRAPKVIRNASTMILKVLRLGYQVDPFFLSTDFCFAMKNVLKNRFLF